MRRRPLHPQIKGLLLSFIILIFLVLSYSIETLAADLVVSGPDDEGTYTYTYGSGTFETNMTDGGTFEIGYFSWDSNINILLMRDGQSVSISNGDPVFQSGSYVALIYDLSSGEFTSFTFTIANTISGMGGMPESGGDASQSADIGDIYSSEIESELGSLDSSVDTLNSLSTMFSSFDSDELDTVEMDFYFVPETGNIIYTALGKDVIEASVPNNVMVNNGVYAKSAGAMSQFTYKDGNIIATPSDYTYREPGYYDIVSFIYTDAGSSGTDEDAGAYAACTHFTFCILDKETAGIGVVNAPRGFHFTGIWFDGNPCNIPDSNAYFMREDGDYYVTYAADTDINLVFSADIHRDTVAPFLEFNQEIADGYASAPVTYTCSEPGAKVTLIVDGTNMSLPENTEIYNSGRYTFRVSDEAGNVREYTFYTKARYKLFSKGMIILLLVFLGMVGVYMASVRHGDYKV